MRKVAELALKSPRHSVLMAVAMACIPMLAWLSAVIVSLVILRHGVGHGIRVMMWAMLPGVVWAAYGQLNVSTGIVVTSVLAMVLRQTVSWQKTLTCAVPMGAVVAFAVQQFSPQLVETLASAVTTFLEGKLSDNTLTRSGLQLEELVKYGVAGALAWMYTLFSVLALILARYWQANLFNPGGFGKEFQQVRLPVPFALFLLTLFAVGSAVSPVLAVAIPVASLPLFFAGLSLVHGLVALRGLGNFWLVGTYAMLIILTQLAYPMIVFTACLDSLFDFRKRVIKQGEE